MTPDAAIAEGAMALFGEKYDEEVRVLAMGREAEKPYSVELCGGTHVKRTGDIAVFKIVTEGAVAAGVRRIEALTGAGALAHMAQREALLDRTASALKATAEDVPVRVEALVEERKRLEREVSELRRKLAAGGGGSAKAPEAAKIAGIRFARRHVEDVPARELKALADELKRQVGSGVVAIAATADGKASLVVGVTDDLTARVSAVDLVRAGAEALGGKGGGGRPDMAQAGGPDASKAQAALDAVGQALARAAAS
jgi:alanyl-tRNA synthetase